MSKEEFILKLSSEGRAWAHILLPMVFSLLAGWHLPQPKYMKKDPDMTVRLK